MEEPTKKEAPTTVVVKKATPAPRAKKAGNQQKKGKGTYKISLEPIAGVRDFPPEEMALRTWLFGHWREVARRFGFEEYDAPILEYEELYKIKAGASFEELAQQMYSFVDRGDQAVTLRPEMTPSLARMALHKGKALLLPVKWFSIPQCWRFEECTRGRKREHYQWNMDIIGVESISAEAELLAAIVSFFKRVGLTDKDIKIKFSSRQVVQSVLEKYNVTGDKFAPTCIIVDKLDKLERPEVVLQLKGLGIEEDIANSIIDALSVKEVSALGAIIGDDHRVLAQLSQLMTLAEAYGYKDWLKFDASIVRGLAYYTGIVFEAFECSGALPRAVCGGGRYDKLFSTYGGQDHPCCGFGFGDIVILEVLKDRKLLPKLQPSVNDIVIPFNEELRPAAVQVATKLREAGRSVDIILGHKKMQQAYSYADRIGAERAILVAPSEWEQGLVRIKLLRSSQGRPLDKEAEATNQQDIPFKDLV